MKLNKKQSGPPIICCAVIVVLLLSGSWLYNSLSPARHFHPDRLPVLATPPPLHNEPVVTQPPMETSSDSSTADRSGPQNSPSSSEADRPSVEQPAKTSGFNLLLLGADSGENEAARSDVIIVAHVDPDEQAINLVSIPRDTQVALPGVGQTKINHAYFVGQLHGSGREGAEAAIGAVSRLFQIPIHYYMKTDFKGFVELIDTIEGIDLELSQDMLLSGTGKLLPAGVNHLDGNTALQFVRERYSLSGGDFGRQAGQAALIRAVANKILSGEQLSRLPGLVKKMKKEFVDTNLSASDMISLALLFKGADGKSIRHVTIPGKPVIEEDPLVGTKLWYWSADAKAVEQISRNYLQ